MSQKKNIKGLEKELFSERERMELWYAGNWKKSIVFGIVIIVVVVAVYAFNYTREKNIRDAVTGFANASIADIPALLEKNPDAKGAAIARMRLAEDLMKKNDYAAAAELFELISIDQKVPSYIADRAAISAAQCLELSGNTAAAAEKYIAAANDLQKNIMIRDEAAFLAGALLVKTGDTAGAEEILGRVSGNAAASMYSSLAGVLLKSLKNGEFK